MKYILLLCLLLATSVSYSQVLGSTFYGNDVQRYKGVKLKVISTPLPFYYFILHKDRPWNVPSNTYLPSNKSDGSDPNRLFGQVFTVTDVLKHPADEGVYLLALKEEKTGQQLYYYYEPTAKDYFAMKVVTDEDEEEAEEEEEVKVDYCSQIAGDRDKFTGAVSYHSPFLSRYNILIYKDITKSKQVGYTLALFTTGSTVNVGGKGVIILLDNKARINRPLVKVDVEAREYDTHGYGDFEYSVYLKLTPVERALLLKHKITDFRLYIYDQVIDAGEAERIQESLKCLANRK